MPYYFPNRPLLMPPENIDDLDDSKWIAEPKYNGDRLVLRKRSGGWEFWNRHKDRLRRYEPCERMLVELDQMAVPDGTQLDGELMHFHVSSSRWKHRVMLYDIYTYGPSPCRQPFSERRCLLESIQCQLDDPSEHVLMSTFVPSGFRGFFDRCVGEEHLEGIVAKRLDGLIEFNAVKSPDVSWQIKFRRPHKNYRF